LIRVDIKEALEQLKNKESPIVLVSGDLMDVIGGKNSYSKDMGYVFKVIQEFYAQSWGRDPAKPRILPPVFERRHFR